MARKIYVPSSMITFFDGSRMNPIKEASIVLRNGFIGVNPLPKRTTVLDNNEPCFDNEANSHDHLDDDEAGSIVSWLVPLRPEINERGLEPVSTSSAICFLESCDAHSPKFSIFHSNIRSCTLLMNNDWGQFLSSNVEGVSDVIDLEECSSMDKPLFWPPSLIPEWGLVAEWDFFAMSPRKNICVVERSPPNGPRSSLFNGKMDLQTAKRRLVFGLGSNSSANLEVKTAKETRLVRRLKSMPSRFKKGPKANGLEALDLANKNGDDKVLMEDRLLTEKLNVVSTIEILLGLEEFDGHEGVESEFDKEDFSLDVNI